MWLWMLGCGAEPVPDAEVYRAVLSDRDGPVDAALRQCLSIQDAALKGDCALSVAGRAQPPGSACPDVPAGLWREECWFVAAEMVNRAGDSTRAVSFCQSAGRFQNDCAQHLWQTPVHRLIHQRGAAGFATALPQAEALYAAWAPLLAQDTDFESRFWLRFFGNGFEGQGPPITLEWCTPLPQQHHDSCHRAAAVYLERELGPAVENTGQLDAFCAIEGPTVMDIQPWLAVAPSTVFDAVIVDRQQDICMNAPGAPQRVGEGSADMPTNHEP